jgi:hypothetical protein
MIGRMPSESEIQQAAQQFINTEPNIVDWRVFKYHNPTLSDKPLEANGVGLAYRVPNPDYDPANVGQPDLECDRADLGWWPERGGWVFIDVDDRVMCFSSTDTLDALITRFLERTKKRLGWVGEAPGENHPPTVTLSYSPENPTPNDTIYFTATASDPDGDPLTYKWFLNDVEQTRATAPNVRWANPTEGTYTMRVVVSDGKGGMAEDEVEFTVQPARPRYVIMPGYPQGNEEPIWIVQEIVIDGQRKEYTGDKKYLYKGAIVRTGPGVEILLREAGGSVWRIKENTTIDPIEGRKYAETPQSVIYGRLIEGLLNFYFPKGAEGARKFEIETDRAVVGIKGTEGTVQHISGVTTVIVTEGEVKVTDKATGTVSTVRAGETARFDGTAPPSGGKSIEQALDQNNNKIIDDLEMLQALQYWIKQQPVPNTNKTIDDLKMLSLLQMWIKGTPIQ